MNSIIYRYSLPRKLFLLGALFKIALIFFSTFFFFGLLPNFFSSSASSLFTPAASSYLDRQYSLLFLIFSSISNISSDLHISPVITTLSIKLFYFVFDLILYYLVCRLSKSGHAKATIFYWLSPVIAYFTYIQGLPDIVSLTLFTASFQNLVNKRYYIGHLFFILAALSSSIVILLCPFIFYYTYKAAPLRHVRKVLYIFLLTVSATLVSVSLLVTLRNHLIDFELVRFFSFRIHLLDSFTLYPSLFLYCVALFVFFSFKRIDSSLLLHFLAVLLILLSITIPVSSTYSIYIILFLVLLSLEYSGVLNVSLILISGLLLTYNCLTNFVAWSPDLVLVIQYSTPPLLKSLEPILYTFYIASLFFAFYRIFLFSNEHLSSYFSPSTAIAVFYSLDANLLKHLTDTILSFSYSTYPCDTAARYNLKSTNATSANSFAPLVNNYLLMNDIRRLTDPFRSNSPHSYSLPVRNSQAYSTIILPVIGLPKVNSVYSSDIIFGINYSSSIESSTTFHLTNNRSKSISFVIHPISLDDLPEFPVTETVNISVISSSSLLDQEIYRYLVTVSSMNVDCTFDDKTNLITYYIQGDISSADICTILQKLSPCFLDHVDSNGIVGGVSGMLQMFYYLTSLQHIRY
jgi:hypothetical protein